MVGLGRLELPTSRLSGVRSNQAELQAHFGSHLQIESGRHLPLSAFTIEGIRRRRRAAFVRLVRIEISSNADILRKEVIQPQVPLRLPCYDFTPVAELTVVGYLKS